MTRDVDLERLVEFKLLLARLTEEYLVHELEAAAKAQGRRLPDLTRPTLRTGVLEAVSRLEPGDLLGFLQAPTWDESIRRAIASGHWTRLIRKAVAIAFPSGAT